MSAEAGTSDDRKRKRDASAELLDAVMRDSLEDVIRLMDDSDPDPNTLYPEPKGTLPILMLAAKYGSAPIVLELMRRGALANLVTVDGNTALHYAAAFGTAESVRVLAEKISVNSLNVHGRTPLHWCVQRNDGRAVEIAQYLLDQGSNLKTRDGLYGYTPFLLACQEQRSSQFIAFLLERGASIGDQDDEGENCLMAAARNRMGDEAIFEVLISAGANITHRDHEGDDALFVAFTLGGGEMVKRLQRFCEPRWLPKADPLLHPVNPDPIGAAREYCGNHKRTLRFKTNDPTSVWASLRIDPPVVANKNGGVDILKALAKHTDARTWYLVGREIGEARQGATANTLLHAAAASNNEEAIGALMRLKLNPLLVNATGKRAIELTTAPSIRTKLLLYSDFQPTPHHARWMGPYFCGRALAFLLVVLRWKTTPGTLQGHSADGLRHGAILVLRELAKLEYV